MITEITNFIYSDWGMAILIYILIGHFFAQWIDRQNTKRERPEFGIISFVICLIFWVPAVLIGITLGIMDGIKNNADNKEP